MVVDLVLVEVSEVGLAEALEVGVDSEEVVVEV